MLPFLLFVGIFLGAPLYVIHGAFTTDNNALTSATSAGLRPVAVPARAQEQRDPVALDLDRSGLFRPLAGGGGGRRQARQPAATDRLECLRRARLLRRPATRVRVDRHIGNTGVVTVFLHNVFGFQLTEHFGLDSLASSWPRLFLFPDPADGDPDHAVPGGNPARSGMRPRAPRRHPLAVSAAGRDPGAPSRVPRGQADAVR